MEQKRKRKKNFTGPDTEHEPNNVTARSKEEKAGITPLHGLG